MMKTTAVATVLLEHLLGQHFEGFFPRVTSAVENVLFADTFRRCHRFDQSNHAGNADRFDGLRKKCQVQRK
jgi:hypothetical protein